MVRRQMIKWMSISQNVAGKLQLGRSQAAFIDAVGARSKRQAEPEAS
jgi:hypothetical protein